jgi:ketosteroid isomerase-like protein
VSQENVDRVLGLYEHFGASGEFRATDFDPEFVMDLSTFKGWPERAAYYGVEGLREFMAEWLEPWETFEQEIMRILDVDDKVVSLMHMRGRSKSGVDAETAFAHVFTLRRGLLTRLAGYADPDEALKAVGLEE